MVSQKVLNEEIILKLYPKLREQKKFYDLLTNRKGTREVKGIKVVASGYGVREGRVVIEAYYNGSKQPPLNYLLFLAMLACLVEGLEVYEIVIYSQFGFIRRCERLNSIHVKILHEIYKKLGN